MDGDRGSRLGVHNLMKSYNGRIVVRDVSLEVASGEGICDPFQKTPPFLRHRMLLVVFYHCGALRTFDSWG